MLLLTSLSNGSILAPKSISSTDLRSAQLPSFCTSSQPGQGELQSITRVTFHLPFASPAPRCHEILPACHAVHLRTTSTRCGCRPSAHSRTTHPRHPAFSSVGDAGYAAQLSGAATACRSLVAASMLSGAQALPQAL